MQKQVFKSSSFPWLLLVLLFLLITTPVITMAQAQSGGPRREGGITKQAVRIWWNKERFHQELGLGEPQRAQWDELLAQNMTARREQAKVYRAARGELAQAIKNEDWSTVEKARLNLSTIAAEMSRLETDLTLRVVQQMTDEQRHQLSDKFPTLLGRPWLVGGMGGGGRR